MSIRSKINNFGKKGEEIPKSHNPTAIARKDLSNVFVGDGGLIKEDVSFVGATPQDIFEIYLNELKEEQITLIAEGIVPDYFSDELRERLSGNAIEKAKYHYEEKINDFIDAEFQYISCYNEFQASEFNIKQKISKVVNECIKDFKNRNLQIIE